MAEPFAAAVLQDEEDAKHPPSSIIPASTQSPAWDLGHTNLGEEQQKTADIQANVGFGEAVSKSFTSGGNIAYELYKDVDRIASSGPVDPNWNKGVNDFLKINRQRINPEQDWRYRQANNTIEANAILADSETSAKDNDILARRGGVSTFVAQGLAGIVDIDTPLTLMTGGLGLEAKAGIMGSKAARIVGGAISGGAVGAALGAVDYASDPNADWTAIPTIGIMGTIMGGIGATLSKGPVAELLDGRTKALDEVGENIANGIPRAKEDLRTEVFANSDEYHSERGNQAEMQAAADAEVAQAKTDKEMTAGAEADTAPVRKPTSVNIDDIERPAITDVETDPDLGKGSIGARQLNQQGAGISSIRSQKILDIVQTARTRVRQLNIADDWNDAYGKLIAKTGPIGKSVSRFADIVNNSPLKSDFAAMMGTGSSVAQTIAYDLLENAAGVIRNGRSAARLMEHYRQTMANMFIPFDDNYQAWAKDVHNAGFFQRARDAGIKDDFNRAVTVEMQARFHDGVGQPNVHPNVKAAADAIDRVFEHELDIVKGRPGETGVFGSDQLVKKSGYMPQKWSGRNIRALIDSQRHSRQDIVDALAETYENQHPNIGHGDALTYADATVTRAINTDLGTNTSVVNVLQGDGRQELFDTLLRKGLSHNEIEKFIDRLTGAMEERNKPGYVKHRLDVDFRGTASNGVELMNLIDTDFQTIVPNRIRKSAGMSALARKGIASRADWEDIKSAIKQEQVANGTTPATGTSLGERVDNLIDKDKHVDDKFLDGLYSYFGGGPINGGNTAMVSRIKKLTNLALLNQLGLTQLAEFGVNIAAVGAQQFYRHASSEIRDALKKADSPLVQELRHMGIYQPEEKLFRDDMIHDFERYTAQSEFQRNADRLLNKLTRIQGFTSGFFAMRRIQQRIAVTSMADKLAQHFRNGGLISDDRLRDMGFSPNDLARLQTYIGHPDPAKRVQFDANGNLVKLNIDQWAPEDADIFAMSLNTNTNMLVQKAMAGESSMAFHKDGLAALFWHLKAFPMLAIEKQTLRQARLMDTEAAMTFLYGLGTATAAYTVKQIANGRDDNLTFGRIAKGGIGMSNMAGWIPMWTDPIAGMLGMDQLKMGGFGGQGQQVISAPAALSTLDNMAQIPGAIAHTIWNGGPSNPDLNAFNSGILVGHAYGFNYMINKMKQDNKADHMNAVRAEHKAAQATSKPTKPAKETVAQKPEDLADPLSKVLK